MNYSKIGRYASILPLTMLQLLPPHSPTWVVQHLQLSCGAEVSRAHLHLH